MLFISKYAQMAATRHILHCYSDNNASVLEPSNFLAAICISLLQNEPIFISGLHVVTQKINKTLLIT